MTATFTPLSRKTLSAEVRDQLVGSIRSGQLPPGTPLPSERQLCTELGVARTSVREAIQGLVSLGIIERRGNRAYIAESLPDLDVNLPKLRREQLVRQLFEVRRIVEVPAARLAAERATDAQRQEIREIAAGFSASMMMPAFRILDRQFHAIIVRSADNPILAEVELKVLESLFTSTDVASVLESPSRTSVSKIVRESSAAHKAIARAVVAADLDAAAAAAGQHLDEVESRLLRTL